MSREKLMVPLDSSSSNLHKSFSKKDQFTILKKEYVPPYSFSEKKNGFDALILENRLNFPKNFFLYRKDQHFSFVISLELHFYLL